MTEASNMTDKEYFKLNGTLSNERIERLLDVTEKFKDIEDAIDKIREGSCQFPREDFLTEIKKSFKSVYRNVRGDNKEDLKAILIDIETLETGLNHDFEYGYDKLFDAINMLEDAINV